jgi:hypothetical protein
VSPEDTDLVTSIRPLDRPDDVPVPNHPHDPGSPWPRPDDQGLTTLPAAGQPGHGRTASLRRRPARIVEGRAEGGYTEAFELICCDCGDHPYLDYSEVSARLQRIRGPYPMRAGLAAFENHLGLAT